MDIYYFKDNSYEEARIGKKKESKLLDSLATTTSKLQCQHVHNEFSSYSFPHSSTHLVFTCWPPLSPSLHDINSPCQHLPKQQYSLKILLIKVLLERGPFQHHFWKGLCPTLCMVSPQQSFLKAGYPLGELFPASSWEQPDSIRKITELGFPIKAINKYFHFSILFYEYKFYVRYRSNHIHLPTTITLLKCTILYPRTQHPVWLKGDRQKCLLTG